MHKLKSKNNSNTVHYFWACDFSQITGEGILANLFIKNFKVNNKLCKIYTVNNLNFKNYKIKKIASYKYITPFLGIFFCWYFYLKGKKVGYINYLPLWNFILFLFLPPKIILGPITGGAKFDRKYQFIIRKYFFYIFYKFSEMIIFKRGIKVYFATELLKNILNKNTISKSKFNFVIKKIYLKKTQLNKKKIDFLIYYKLHKNKNILFPYKLIKNLVKLNFKIYIVGDKLNIVGVKNLRIVNNKRVNALLSNTFFTISSNENPYTMFNLECINNNVKIITTKKNNDIKYFKKAFLFLNKKKITTIKNFLNQSKKAIH